MSHWHRRKEQKAQYAEQSHFLGKPAASLVSRLKMGRESFLPWYSPLILMCQCSPRQAGMKLEQEGWGQSTESSGPWDNWLRAEGHKQCSSLSFQMQGMKREGRERARRSTPGSEPGGTGRIWGFWSWVHLHNIRSAGERQGKPQRGKMIFAKS